MDGIPKGGENKSPSDMQVNEDKQARGHHSGRGVKSDEGEKNIPLLPLSSESHNSCSQDRPVSIPDWSDDDWSDDDWSDAGDDVASASEIDQDDDLLSEPAYSSWNRDEGSDSEIIFMDTEDSNFSAVMGDLWSDIDSDSTARRQKKSGKPDNLSLGDIPDLSEYITEYLDSGKDPSEIREELEVVRYTSSGGRRVVMRSRSVESGGNDADATLAADNQEAIFLNSIKSDHVIGFIGYKGTADKKEVTSRLYMQDGGVDVQKAIASVEDSARISTLRTWLLHLARGLAALKKENIIHRDIKPENLLIDQNSKHLRIADLGNAFQVNNNKFPSDVTGSEFYLAPETRAGKLQNFQADIYSAGIAFVKIMIDMNVLDLTTWQEFQALHNSKQTLPLPLAKDLAGDKSAISLIVLIEQMIDLKSSRRPDAESIIKQLDAGTGKVQS
ncbi:protein kinase family protein [Endozoicomonas sp.]|uniref:protein kinase family protein n=1 Tax=Endozoicomonas sp. TaxID=1892382 RepID=UPI002888BA45|nr:protein kinase family protein [Endozoicomonas sp.]